MAKNWDLLIKGGQVFTPSGLAEVDVAVAGERIADIGTLDATRADEVLDAKGLLVLPGVIDTQVHFREPGLEHKEDLESGTRSAVMGGRSEEHTSELQSLMRISYAVFCLTKK